MKKLLENPYRVLFPIGWVLALWGGCVWGLYYLGIKSYPGVEHPQIMMGGFLLCFIVGFLMTAAPKFTGSFPATKKELISAAIMGTLMLPCSFFGFRALSYLLSFFMFGFLVIFLRCRFKARRNDPPAPFVFILLGIISGALSSLLLSIDAFGLFSLPPIFIRIATLFYNQGFVLALVSGIGSRLVPALLGWMPSPLEGGVLFKVRPFVILMFILILSYVFEALQFEILGRTLRALLFGWLSFTQWKIYKLPKIETLQAKMLWLSAWGVLLGLTGQIWADYRIHFLHLMFIGGFGLMTFMVAVRVTLSHGNHGLELESKSKAIWLAGTLIVLTALFRVLSGFFPERYFGILALASIFWGLALVIWGIVFLPKMVKEKGS
jgi:uncharacterized protein involved in response to NO